MVLVTHTYIVVVDDYGSKNVKLTGYQRLYVHNSWYRGRVEYVTNLVQINNFSYLDDLFTFSFGQ